MKSPVSALKHKITNYMKNTLKLVLATADMPALFDAQMKTKCK